MGNHADAGTCCSGEPLGFAFSCHRTGTVMRLLITLVIVGVGSYFYHQLLLKNARGDRQKLIAPLRYRVALFFGFTLVMANVPVRYLVNPVVSDFLALAGFAVILAVLIARQYRPS